MLAADRVCAKALRWELAQALEEHGEGHCGGGEGRRTGGCEWGRQRSRPWVTAGLGAHSQLRLWSR